MYYHNIIRLRSEQLALAISDESSFDFSDTQLQNARAFTQIYTKGFSEGEKASEVNM